MNLDDIINLIKKFYLFIKIFRIIYRGLTTFISFVTRKTKNITWDGILFQIPYEKCDADAKNGVYTAYHNGKYVISWRLLLEGITDQDIAIVEIETSNKRFSVNYPSINAFKNSKGNTSLTGNAIIQMDRADTVKIKAQTQDFKNREKVSLSQSQSSFFCDLLVKPV